jgi:hypothetical protein
MGQTRPIAGCETTSARPPTRSNESARPPIPCLAGDVIVIALVHGWKHDARSDDCNLQSFQRMLDDTVQREQQEVQQSDGAPRPVLGVFVGWRGMSLYDSLRRARQPDILGPPGRRARSKRRGTYRSTTSCRNAPGKNCSSSNQPVFVFATATNDWATGIAFPIGSAYTLLTQSWLGPQERQATINTMGHLDWLPTIAQFAEPAREVTIAQASYRSQGK